ncbi:MAG: radical SAM protein [Pelagibacterales bacterium]|nr:radical SAM protein [Pelagibacterales bacterium]
MSASISTGYAHVKRLAKIIREELPETLIVMGGYLAGSSDPVVKCTEVDMTVVGDGEVAWLAILDCLTEEQLSIGPRNIPEEKLKNIRGTYFYDKSGKLHHEGFGDSIPANDIPFPDYDFYERGMQNHPDKINVFFRDYRETGNQDFYFDPRASDPKKKKKYLASLFTSKGCVAACTFCQREAGGYRVFDLKEFDKHLEFIKNKYDVGFIKLLDENWGQNKKHAYEVAKILKKHNMLWLAVGRCTSFTYEDVKFYKECGLSALKFGVESGSQKILDIMEKRYKVDEIRNALLICAELNIQSTIPTVLGMPGETETTCKETGNLIGSVAASIGAHPENIGCSYHYLLPLPGTPVFQYAQEVGIIGKEPREVGEFLDRVSGASIYKRYYFNLNGAPQSEVIFWETLIRLEASRIFRKLRKKVKPIASEKTREIFLKMYEKEVRDNPNYNRKFKYITFTLITIFIEKYIIGRAYIDIIPRWIIYPIVKWLGYFEYCIQGLFPSNRVHNIYQNNIKVPRLNEDDIQKGIASFKSKRSVRGKSLRGIVLGKKKSFV